jgi:hypothetical protein
VRQREGYEHFLQPKHFSELRQVASGGPVVILNASSSGCDALVITQSGVQCVPLPNLELDDVSALHSTLQTSMQFNRVRCHPSDRASRPVIPGRSPEDQFRFVLGELWRLVSLPVVRALHLKVMPSLLFNY